jgi:hypothetical protein
MVTRHKDFIELRITEVIKSNRYVQHQHITYQSIGPC